MFFKSICMEFKKSVFRSNTIAVLLLILFISFMTTIDFKNGIETEKYQNRLNTIVAKNEVKKAKLDKMLNSTNSEAERLNIRKKINSLNISKISPKVIKSPLNIINNSAFNLLYLAIIIGILFGDIFSKEYSTKIDSLLFSSKVSRTTLVFSKIISSFVIIILVNLIFFISCYGMGFIYLKDTSFNIPMQQLVGLELIQSNMSVIKYISIGFLYSNLVCFFFVALMIFISSLTKNYLFPVFSGVLLGFITLMSSNLWVDYSYIVKFIPSSYLSYILLTEIKSMYNISWSLPLILILISTVLFITLTNLRIAKKQV